MWTIKSLNKSNSVNINPFFMILPPFNSSQWDESNELNIIKNESVVIEIAIIYFLLNLGYLTTFWPLLFRPFRPFRPYFDPISTWFFNFGFMYNLDGTCPWMGQSGTVPDLEQEGVISLDIWDIYIIYILTHFLIKIANCNLIIIW